MEGIRLNCPHCDSVLRIPAGAAGKRVRCPSCRDTLDVPPPRQAFNGPPPAQSIAAVEVTPLAVRRNLAAPTFEDEDRPYPPRKTRKGPRARRGTTIALLIGLSIFVSIVLVVGATTLIIVFWPKSLAPDAASRSAAFHGTTLFPPLIEIPIWQPDPAFLGDLDAPTIMEGYRIRPPKGFDYQEHMVGAVRVHLWKNENLGGGRIAFFNAQVATAAPQEPLPLPEDFLGGYFMSLKKTIKDWREGPHEHGQIAGVEFVRVAWSGTENRFNRPTHGVVYSGVRGRDIIGLSGTEHVGKPSMLPLLETAARAFSPP